MQQKTVLIIEDSITLADSIEDMLSLKGHLAFKVTSGKNGLAVALEEHPDLIILDLKLPDIDGIEILKVLREDSWGKTAKVLILTASDFVDNDAPDLKIPSEKILYKSQCSIEDISKCIETELSS